MCCGIPIADSCSTPVLRRSVKVGLYILGGYVANAYRISKKETKRKPKNKKLRPLAATKKLWAQRTADFWTATSILQYLKHRSVVYSATIDGVLIELCEMLDGTVHPQLLEKYHRAIEIGIERNLFRLQPDDEKDPRCWGLWIPAGLHSRAQSSSTRFLILATG